MLTLSQSVHVSLAYRYWNSQWSDAENQKHYGTAASQEGIGGNWRIEITCLNSDRAEKELKAQLQRIKSIVDHRALFTDLPEFTNRPSTLESVTDFLAKDLFSRGESWTALTIFENDQVWCRQNRGETRQCLSLKILNLTLSILGQRDEGGLIISRSRVTQEVIDLLPQFQSGAAGSEESWAKTLFQALGQRLTGLNSLRVDLGSGRYIVVESS